MKYAISTLLLATLLAGCAAPGFVEGQKSKVDGQPSGTDAPVASAPAKGQKPKVERPLKPTQRVDALLKSIDSAKNNYSNRIEKVAAMLDEPDFATNAVNRAYVREKIIDLCLTPGWTKITLWDPNLKDIHLEPAALAILNDAEVPVANKITPAAKYARYLAGAKRFDEAEKVAREAIARCDAKDPIVSHKATSRFILADVFRWQDRYDEAMAVLMEAMPFLPGDTAKKASGLAFDFGHADRIPAIWKAANVPLTEFDYYSSSANGDLLPGYDDVRRRAYAFVSCATNTPKSRFAVARAFVFGAHDADAVKALESMRSGDFSGIGAAWWDSKAISTIFQRGDYARFADICDILEAAPIVNTAPMRLARVAALGACGRAKEGAALAAAWAQDEKIQFSPSERAWLRFADAILSGRPTDSLAEETGLPAKERAELFAYIAGICQVWGRTDLAESFAARHEALLVPPPKRVCHVRFTEKPIESAEDWRRLWPKLEKHYCDVQFKGSLQFLETDVATGVRRDIAIDKDGKPFSFMEMTAACDIRGLHIFLRLETDEARSIENGFGNAGSCETYLAPGKGQPYACIGVGPRGIEYTFQTTYDNANHRRLDTTGKKSATSFSTKTYYTDHDYTIHLFYAWNPYAAKLPAPGADWRFDCISTQPFGRYTWGGSQGVHSASAWGDLRFDLTPKQLTAIRRRLLFSTFRSYANVHYPPSATMNLFDYWKDPAVGDPAFFEKYLRPLQEELKGYAARVKEDMTDEEVDEVYTKGLLRWIALRDNIEGLHRRYLAEKFTD